MPSRVRGATYLLVALLAGRALDGFDLPFEAPSSGVAPGPDSSFVPPDSSGFGVQTIPDDVISANADPLDINNATTTELVRLPGVGPVLAERIVLYRKTHGPLRSLTDLQCVQGIGARTAKRLGPHVRFD